LGAGARSSRNHAHLPALPFVKWDERSDGWQMPGVRKRLQVEKSASRRGALVRVLSICGREAFPSYTRDPGVQVQFSPVPDDLRLTLGRTIDDRGRDVAPGFATRMGDGTLIFGLPGAADHSHLRLTFAVQRPRSVEFLVKPSLP
jgi:hypothetical protein